VGGCDTTNAPKTDSRPGRQADRPSAGRRHGSVRLAAPKWLDPVWCDVINRVADRIKPRRPRRPAHSGGGPAKPVAMLLPAAASFVFSLLGAVEGGVVGAVNGPAIEAWIGALINWWELREGGASTATPTGGDRVWSNCRQR
jgi:hypothetical protein